MNIRIFKLWPLFCLLATGCYEEEHFSFPGSIRCGRACYGHFAQSLRRSHTNGYWLIRDGVWTTNRWAFGDIPILFLRWMLLPCRGMRMVPASIAGPITTLRLRPMLRISTGTTWLISPTTFIPAGFLESGKGKSWYVYAKLAVDYAFNNLRFDYNCYVGSKGWNNRAVFFSNHKDNNYPCCTWFYAEQSTIGMMKAGYHQGLTTGCRERRLRLSVFV